MDGGLKGRVTYRITLTVKWSTCFMPRCECKEITFKSYLLNQKWRTTTDLVFLVYLRTQLANIKEAATYSATDIEPGENKAWEKTVLTTRSTFRTTERLRLQSQSQIRIHASYTRRILRTNSHTRSRRQYPVFKLPVTLRQGILIWVLIYHMQIEESVRISCGYCMA